MADINVNITTPAFTGDSGTGGVQGQVPAPAAGDAAAGKYLHADGTWKIVGGGSPVQRTGAAIAFDQAAIYNDPTTPSDAAVTVDLTGAVAGTEVVAFFDHAAEPVWPAGVTPAGQWANGQLNIVRFLFQDASNISAAIISDITGDSAGTWRTVLKTSAQERTSSTTPTDDADLRFPVDANSQYIVRGRILIGFQSTVGLKYSVVQPTGTAGQRSNFRHKSTRVAPADIWSTSNPTNIDFTSLSGGGFGVIDFEQSFVTGANSGEWIFQFAQVVSDPTNWARTEQNSYLEWIKVA